VSAALLRRRIPKYVDRKGQCSLLEMAQQLSNGIGDGILVSSVISSKESGEP
jgi:hypothetical protein